MTSGSVNVDIVYDKFIPISKKYDICSLITDIGKHCPIQKGNFTVSADAFVSTIPKVRSLFGIAIMHDINYY